MVVVGNFILLLYRRVENEKDKFKSPGQRLSSFARSELVKTTVFFLFRPQAETIHLLIFRYSRDIISHRRNPHTHTDAFGCREVKER